MGIPLTITFEQACKDANVTRWIEDWDYEKNGCGPDEVAYKSNKKYWFKCYRGLHESTAAPLYNLVNNFHRADEYKLCKECNSIGQFIIDTQGEEHLWKIWSDKNEKSPFEISRGSFRKRVWLKCLDDPTHPDYDLFIGNYTKSGCPYCSGHRVCLTNSFGYKYPDYLHLWSDKNTKTPYEYTYGSGEEVWWKCDSGIHNAYKRSIDRSASYNFRCPICGKENQKHPNGNEHPNWKGGITPSHKTERKTKEYNEWRSSVYERDKYLCQICLDPSHNKLRAHHIFSFKSYPNKRYDIYNGITLCEECHDTTYYGSFHQVYGTHNNTPDQFNEFANRKRKELGITTPFNIYDYMGDLQDPTEEPIDFTEEWSDDSAITDTSSQSVA